MANVKSTHGSTPRNWGRKNSVLGGATAAAEGATRKSGK